MAIDYPAAQGGNMVDSGSGGFGDALRRLKGSQKSAKGAPLYSLVVNRPLGRVFAAAAYVLHLTPNQVTAVSAVSTYAGILTLALAPPTVATGLLVAALLVLGYALDSADGQLARLRGGGSLAGEWLDHVIDSGKIATLHVAVLVSFWSSEVSPTWWLAVPIGFGVFYVVHFFGMLLTELLLRLEAARRGEAHTSGAASLMMSVLKLPTDYGVLCLAFVLLGFDPLFRWVYLVLALAMAGYTLLVLGRWYGQVRRLG